MNQNLILNLFFMGIVCTIISIEGIIHVDQHNTFLKQTSKLDLISNYVIEPLRGDTMTVTNSRILSEYITFKIIDSENISTKNLETLRKAIFSTDTIEIPNIFLHKGPVGHNSTYWTGWQGILDEMQNEQKKTILVETNSVNADVIINLKTYQNGDGYSGLTKNTLNHKNDIIKSYVTIYDSQNLSQNQIHTITIHEIGHVFGLTHSTDPEDLMSPIISTIFPYISECNLDVLNKLYKNKTQINIVICEK